MPALFQDQARRKRIGIIRIYGKRCKSQQLHGKIEFIRALISYEATDAKGIRKAFEEAVEDYLEMCQTQGIKAEAPFKGSLNVRLGSELHRRIAIAAKQKH